MSVITLRELEEKEVINLCDGSILGTCVDLELETGCATVSALLVKPTGGCFSFAKNEPIRISWNRIECIGEETILVRVAVADLPGTGSPKKKCKL